MNKVKRSDSGFRVHNKMRIPASFPAGKSLPPSDPLVKLQPQLDTTAEPVVFRVGGRPKLAENLPKDLC